MDPRQFLRVEGLAAATLALGSYVVLDGSVWLLLALGLVPDLSMLGYLAGPRVGSLSYNLVHTYTGPIILGGLGYWADVRLGMLLAAIWATHIGADRLFGYGLKFPTGFAETHLSSQPAPVALLGRDE